MTATAVTHPGDGKVLPIAPTLGTLTPLGRPSVTIEGGFWARLQEVNHSAIIPHAQDWMERVGWIGNFDAAVAGTLPQSRRGREFSDSDVYKLMEAIAWEHGRTRVPDLDERFRALTARVAPVQEPDGYLNTMFGRVGQEPRYSALEWGHELYCYGHLFQAAVARLRTSGPDEFVDIALRAADHVCLEFGDNGRDQIGGHPEIETGLAELARATGEDRYLRQAKIFVERRGRNTLADIELGREYFQDDTPIREATIARGHAVRAMYLASGATDVAVETDDTELLDALILQARNTLARRTYITGGMGARHTGEAFGEDFSLPPDRSYSETCAGVAAVQFFQRLLLATGDPGWADHVERTLFNIIATSPSEDGRSFFYANTLFRREAGDVPAADVPSPRADSSMRAPWYDVSCCPTNVARTLASLDSYVATRSARGLQINQYVPGRISASLGGGVACVRVETEYPNSGEVSFLIEEAPEGAWQLALRVPSWAEESSVTIDAEKRVAKPGYLVVDSPREGTRILLELPMKPTWVWPDPRIDALRGQAAVQRGPIVYCLEETDLGHNVGDVVVNAARQPLDSSDGVVIQARIVESAEVEWPYVPKQTSTVASVERIVSLVPYHSWGNRGPTSMRVWLPVSAE